MLTGLLAAVFAAAGTVLLVFEETAAGWVMLVIAIFGMLCVIGMTYNDAREHGGCRRRPIRGVRWRQPRTRPAAGTTPNIRPTLLYGAAVAYVASQMLAGEEVEEEFDPTSPVVRASIVLALLLMRSTPARYGSEVPQELVSQMTEERVADLGDQIAKTAVSHAEEHWKTIEARVRRSNPAASVQDVADVYTADTAWQRAAARTAATRQAAETALGMVDDVNKEAEQDHRVVWISRGDHKVRMSHRRLHGKHRKPGSSFKSWPSGQRLAFPGDPRAPLDETINCRCALILVPESASHLAPDTFRVSDEDWAEINRASKIAASAGWAAAAAQAELDLAEEIARL